MQEPASYDTFSIGEEQSPSHVVALKWSPPGLAKHGRCALAVLTSNFILSIWEPTTNPADAKCWKRVLIINDALEEYYAPRLDVAESLRTEKRIRAIAWADTLYGAGQESNVSRQQQGMHQKSGERRIETKAIHGKPMGYFLAVTNHSRKLAFLRVSSPFLRGSYGSSARAWSAEVVFHIDGDHISFQSREHRNVATPEPKITIPTANNEPKHLNTLDTILQQNEHSLVWSPWQDHDGGSLSVFSSMTGNLFRQYSWAFHHEDIGRMTRGDVVFPTIEPKIFDDSISGTGLMTANQLVSLHMLILVPY